MKMTGLLRAGTVALGLTPAIAAAQTITPPLNVTASPDVPSMTVPDAAEARQRIEKTPGGVALVPAEDVRDGRANTVKDILDYVPGVFAQSKYGQEDSRLAIRGSGLSRNVHLRGTRILRDGIPVTDADGAGDTMEIDPLAVDYTEIYKGANALQYGASLLGGAVNFVSPTGRSQPGFLLRQELGSFGALRSQFGAGGVHGDYDYHVTPTYSHSNGFRDHTGQYYRRLNGNFGYRFGGGAETRFFLFAADIDQKTPSALTKAQALSNPKQTAASSFRGNTKRNIDAVRGANKTTFLTDTGEITVGAFLASRKLFHPLYGGFNAVIDNDEINGGGFARWTDEQRIGGHRNETTLGVNYFAGQMDARQFANIGGRRGNLISDSDQISRSWEIYGENAFYILPEVAVIAGLQGSLAYREYEDHFLGNGDQSFRRHFDSINPKLGIRWDVTPQHQLFANLNWSSEPPPFFELGTTTVQLDLKAQESKTLEFGARGRSGDLAWDAALYRAWLDNELQYQTIDSITNVFNAGRTMHQGVELGGAWTALRDSLQPGDRTTLRAAYTFSDFRFDGDPVFGDNDIPGAPRHFLRAELRYTHADGWYFGPNVEWVPQGYYADNANTLKTEAYALLGAKAGYDFDNGLRIFLDGRNLLDKAYISNTNVAATATPASALFNPGDGRAIYAGMEFRW
jgi:iron complex outermembrane receptor protein